MAGVQYVGFVDPSGGVGDSFALAIAHREEDRVSLDLVHAWRAPLSLEVTVTEAAAMARQYRLTRVAGDRYSQEFVRERFQTQGVQYVVADRTRSDLYLGFLPLLTSGRAQVLDDPRLEAQLCARERRTGASAQDTITDPRAAHDDLANAAAGILVTASRAAPQLQLYAADGHGSLAQPGLSRGALLLQGRLP